jgi:hypothetical protein
MVYRAWRNFREKILLFLIIIIIIIIISYLV